MADGDAEVARAEVVRHHEQIAAWLSGRLPRTPSAFATLERAHHSRFTMITPEGLLLDRAAVLARLEAAHASSGTLRIRVHEVRVIATTPELFVARCIEAHEGAPNPAPARRSTAVLMRGREGDGRLRFRWAHLHESCEAGR